MKIYTKTGDDGTTSLFDGTRVAKNDARVSVYGDIDELNSVIGLAAAFIEDTNLKEQLEHIQRDLFALGANLANPSARRQKEKSDFNAEKILQLEKYIDTFDLTLPAMTNFILPGGHASAAALHLARTVCRRAERNLITLSATDPLPEIFIMFLNRLSDYLFTAARQANVLQNRHDVKW